MRTISKLLTAVSALALAGAAYAADLPTRKAPMAPAPIEPAFTWTGAYVGGFIGGNWNRVAPISLDTGRADPVLNGNGLTIGGLGGYNYQFNQFVLGGEIEMGYDKRGASASFVVPGAGATTESAFGNFEGRLRGRLGYAIGPVLLFVAGGGTLSDLKLTYTNALNQSQSISHVRGGYNIGGGAEWAFSQHWTVRGEYIYDGYLARGYGFSALTQPALFSARSGKLSESTARAVLSYKF